MATVYFGHTSAKQLAPGISTETNGSQNPSDCLNNQPVITAITVPTHLGLDEQLLEIRTAYRLHASDDPAWVHADDEFLAEALVRTYNCPKGEPEGWLDAN